MKMYGMWYGLDKYKNVIPLDEAPTDKEWRKNQRVAATTMKDGRWVSTVFLKLDHNYKGWGKPILFETMVFEDSKLLREVWGERYETYNQALKGHNRIVQKLKRRLPMDVE